MCNGLKSFSSTFKYFRSSNNLEVRWLKNEMAPDDAAGSASVYLRPLTILIKSYCPQSMEKLTSGLLPHMEIYLVSGFNTKLLGDPVRAMPIIRDFILGVFQ